MSERIRVVVADACHGDDAAHVARALRDAGVEVVWTGPDQTPAQVAGTAVQEDVTAVGVAGADDALLADVRALLDGLGAADVVVCAAADLPARLATPR